ncbi:MAG: hypothetical protein RID91_14220 [Azospirillaceae bacterium]
MPRQNRVDPWGEIHAVAARGMLMGNRGGRLHDDAGGLGRRRWTAKRWIACRLDFKGGKRTIMGSGYTELFFLDEATAFAAGHRPCRECRRADYDAFAVALAAGLGLDLEAAPKADAIDARLHGERRGSRRGAPGPAPIDPGALPAGAIAVDSARPDRALLRVPGGWRAWSFEGYTEVAPPADPVTPLTPASILAALAGGYAPALHPSADA